VRNGRWKRLSRLRRWNCGSGTVRLGIIDAHTSNPSASVWLSLSAAIWFIGFTWAISLSPSIKVRGNKKYSSSAILFQYEQLASPSVVRFLSRMGDTQFGIFSWFQVIRLTEYRKRGKLYIILFLLQPSLVTRLTIILREEDKRLGSVLFLLKEKL
jgi:hypothetical protein